MDEFLEALKVYWCNKNYYYNAVVTIPVLSSGNVTSWVPLGEAYPPAMFVAALYLLEFIFRKTVFAILR